MDIVIMHGTEGSPEGNWFPWLKKEMEAAGHDVYVPRFPTPENQNMQSWCKVLREETPIYGENTILIGHSAGAAYMLRLLEVLGISSDGELDQKVAKSIFVSGFFEKLGNEYYDNLNSDFIEHEFNWDRIKMNMGIASVFHGDNDLYVPLSAAENLGENLGVPVTVIPNGGHLNTESGYTKFPEILKVLI